jgi:hypothetical protein
MEPQKMKCKSCNSELKRSEFLIHHIIFYCDKCYDHFTVINNENVCCENPDFFHVRKLLNNGKIVLNKQCRNCGYILYKPIAYKDDKSIDINKFPFADEKLNIDRRKIIQQEVTNAIKKNAIIRESLHKNDFEDYYKSEKWMYKREKVLKRDNYLCQSCLDEKAIQVHHLTYDHFGDEPLFDLVSVCLNCHKKITDIDRNKKYKGLIV